MSIGRLGVVALLLHGLASSAMAEVESRVIHFTHGDVVVEGVIAWDDSATDTRPGVVVIHGGWGYSDNVRAQARRLAESGYVGYAVDTCTGWGRSTPTSKTTAVHEHSSVTTRCCAPCALVWRWSG